jgi:hypothetical protein
MREATSGSAPGPIDVLATLLVPETVWSSSETEAACAHFRRYPFLKGWPQFDASRSQRSRRGAATEPDTLLVRLLGFCRSPRRLARRASFARHWSSCACGVARQSFANDSCLARWPGSMVLCRLSPRRTKASTSNEEPSDGLEPSTPPYHCAPKRLPGAATACQSGCLSRFLGGRVCDRLPPVASAGLHKRSMLGGVIQGAEPIPARGDVRTGVAGA